MKRMRLKAAGTHLAISAVFVSIVVSFIFFAWYPPPLLSVEGGSLFIALIVGVDLGLGPLLTFVVSDPAKSRAKLVFNLSVIGVCQIAALVYGVKVAFDSRPAYVAYANGHFAVVAAYLSKSMRLNELPIDEKYQSLPFWGIEWVGVRVPTDKATLERIEFLRTQGVEVHALPQYYVDIANSRNEIRAAARPLAKLKGLNPGETEAIDAAIAKAGGKPDNVGYLPVSTPGLAMSVLIDKNSGEVLKMMDLRPD